MKILYLPLYYWFSSPQECCVCLSEIQRPISYFGRGHTPRKKTRTSINISKTQGYNPPLVAIAQQVPCVASISPLMTALRQLVYSRFLTFPTWGTQCLGGHTTWHGCGAFQGPTSIKLLSTAWCSRRDLWGPYPFGNPSLLSLFFSCNFIISICCKYHVSTRISIVIVWILGIVWSMVNFLIRF